MLGALISWGLFGILTVQVCKFKAFRRVDSPNENYRQICTINRFLRTNR